MQLTRNVTHLEGESAKGKGGKGKGKDKRGEKGKGKQPVVWCGDSSNPKCWRQLVLPNATTGLLPREMEVSHSHLYLYLSSLVPSYTPSYMSLQNVVPHDARRICGFFTFFFSKPCSIRCHLAV